MFRALSIAATLLAVAGCNASPSPNGASTCESAGMIGRFDPRTDVFIGHFDSKPDVDDLHTIAAVGSLLRHDAFACVNAIGVAGAYGVQGGGLGAVGEQRIEPVEGDAFIPPKYGVRRLGPARIVADTPGGGGWGDPFARPAELVLRDMRDGVLSREAAARDYGVAVDGLNVDAAATAALRAR